MLKIIFQTTIKKIDIKKLNSSCKFLNINRDVNSYICKGKKLKLKLLN
jgi:hypothetical protein